MNKLLFPLCVAFITAALVGGFMMVGGPSYARMERNDQQRILDLRRLARYYRCQPEVHQSQDHTEKGCQNQMVKPDVTDPVSADAYDFALVDAETFEVCADFETDIEDIKARQGRGVHELVFEGQRGCIRHGRTSAGLIFHPMDQFIVTPKS